MSKCSHATFSSTVPVIMVGKEIVYFRRPQATRVHLWSRNQVKYYSYKSSWKTKLIIYGSGLCTRELINYKCLSCFVILDISSAQSEIVRGFKI